MRLFSYTMINIYRYFPSLGDAIDMEAWKGTPKYDELFKAIKAAVVSNTIGI